MLALRDKISLGKNLLCMYNDRFTSHSYMCKFCGYDEMQLPLLVILIHVCSINQNKIRGWSPWSRGSAQPSLVTDNLAYFIFLQTNCSYCDRSIVLRADLLRPDQIQADAIIQPGNKSWCWPSLAAVHTGKQRSTMTLLFTHSEEGNTAGVLFSLLFFLFICAHKINEHCYVGACRAKPQQHHMAS